MTDLIKNNKIITIALAIMLVVAAYFFFTSDDGLPGGSERSGVSSEVQLVGSRVFQMVRRFEQIELGGGVFNDPAFRSLAEFDLEPASKEQGRDDPFAPLGPYTGTGLVPREDVQENEEQNQAGTSTETQEETN